MVDRKSISFKEQASICLFFISQAPNILLETYNDTLITPPNPDDSEKKPAICNLYTLSSDSDEIIEESPFPLINYINLNEVLLTDCHFFLYINNPGEYILSIVEILHNFFGPDKIESFFIVRPKKYTDQDEDFKISYQGVFVGVIFKETEYCKEYITMEAELKIPKISSVKIIPGPRGEHIWNKFLINKSYLQGFFFVGEDIVDLYPDRLCYIASIPKGYRPEYIRKEIYSHTKEYPLHILHNPLEERSIYRLEFEKPETVRFLLRRCMSIEGKSVLVLPCKDRTPVEQIYKDYQVCVSGYTNAIHPKEFIRVLSQSFGPVVELNINFEAFESLVVFQTASAALKCAEKKEIFLKNHKIKFCSASKPYRLTGQKMHKGVYNTSTPQRPLPLVPAPYEYRNL